MTTKHGELTGRPFRLSHGEDFVPSSAKFSHVSEAGEVVFKDGCGHYAYVVGVKNPAAWIKAHKGEDGET
jgi:hypothetical protein